MLNASNNATMGQRPQQQSKQSHFLFCLFCLFVFFSENLARYSLLLLLKLLFPARLPSSSLLVFNHPSNIQLQAPGTLRGLGEPLYRELIVIYRIPCARKRYLNFCFFFMYLSHPPEPHDKPQEARNSFYLSIIPSTTSIIS